MGITNSLKSFADKVATQAKEKHVSLEVTSGQKQLNMGLFSSSIVMRENSDGKIYFDGVPGTFSIVDYSWDGPQYKSVTTADTIEQQKGKGKTKRKGGLGGAMVGTLLMPGVGTAIGYAMTSKKVSKNKSKLFSNTIVNEEQVEVKGNARLTLQQNETGNTFVIGIKCDTKLDTELQNFPIQRHDNIDQCVTIEKDSVALLKEYKDLLDSGIITQEDFDSKKKELLGL